MTAPATGVGAQRSLPAGWRWVRLGDILDMRKEVVHPRDNPSGRDVFVGLEHLEPGTGKRIGAAEVDEGSLTGRKPRFCKGDVVYGYLRPYLNKVWVAEFDGLCSVDQYVYSVSSTQADPSFVAWFMRSPVYLERAPIELTPGQLPRIRTAEVASVRMELPPLDEQRRIVALLEEQMAAVERARAAAEAQLEAARALESARLRSVFDGPQARHWPRKPLGEVGEIVSGVTLGRQLRDVLTRRVPYLRVANVKDGYLDLSEVYEIEATEAELERLRLRPGDLLLTEGGDPDKLGRGTFWKGQLPDCIHQNHIFRVRFDPLEFLPEFVSAQVGSPYGKSYFLARAKRTTGIATINQKVLAGFPLMAPRLDDQRRIASMLDERMVEAERLRRVAEDQLAAIHALPAALLRRVFSGALGRTGFKDGGYWYIFAGER